MSMEINAVGFQPRIKSGVLFHLPEGNGCVDMEMESNRVVVIIGGIFAGWMTDAVNVLGQCFARWNVAVHGNASKWGVGVNRKDGVLVVDVLELL